MLNFIKPSFEGRLTLAQFQRANLIPCLLFIVLCIGFIIAGSLYLIPLYKKPNDIFIISAIKLGGIFLAICIPFFVIWLSLVARRLRDANLPLILLLLLLIPWLGMTGIGILALADTAKSPDAPAQFSDLKNSFNKILNPGNRMSMNDWCISAAVLGFCYSIASSVISIFTLPAFTLTKATHQSSPLPLLSNILLIVFFVFFIRLCVARLHDTGRSGTNFWWSLLCGIGFFIPMIQCYADSDGENSYGLPSDSDDKSADDENNSDDFSAV